MKRTLAAALCAALAVLALAATAQADSISYLKDGNVWVAAPDGSRQTQLTTGGGYTYQSQADDGTIIALTGRRLQKMGRDGRVLADFATPVSGDAGPNNSTFRGPFDPAISPDGTKVAYTYYWQYYFWNPYGCGGYGCNEQHLEGGVGYTYSDHITGWDEPGLGRQSGWLQPSWTDNAHVLASDKTVAYGNENFVLDTVGDGNQNILQWFSEPTDATWYLRDAEMNRQHTLIAAVGTIPKSYDQTYSENDDIRLYRMNGEAPAQPTQCFEWTGAAGEFNDPSFSPDGRRFAVGDTGDGIYVVQVPDASAPCHSDPQSGQLVIPGGRNPDWGPADVPAAKTNTNNNTDVHTGPDNPPPARQVSITVKAPKLKKALAKGLVVNVNAGEAGAATAAGKSGRATVAKGSARVGSAGAGKVVVRFTKKAQRALAKKRSVKLTVTVTFRPAKGGAPQTASSAVKLKK